MHISWPHGCRTCPHGSRVLRDTLKGYIRFLTHLKIVKCKIPTASCNIHICEIHYTQCDSTLSMTQHSTPWLLCDFSRSGWSKGASCNVGAESAKAPVTHVLQPVGDCLATKKQLQPMQPLCDQNCVFRFTDQSATGRRQLSLKIGDQSAIGRRLVGDWLPTD